MGAGRLEAFKQSKSFVDASTLVNISTLRISFRAKEKA